MATRAFALSGSNLISFDTAAPSTITGTVGITGITAGETLIGIDFRPANNQLYGYAVNAAANTGTLYIINPFTGAATAVGGALSVPDFPDPATAGYGFDFNPSADRIRITADDGLNLRVNPNNGVLSGDDPDINGAATGVSGAAYINNQPTLGGSTTLLVLDPVDNELLIQNPPNAGVVTTIAPITLSGSPLDFTGVSGFDIGSEVQSLPGAAGVSFGFAGLTVAGVTGLYRIDLFDGTATLLGNIGTGAVSVSGLALAQNTAPIITSNGGGDNASTSVAENTTAVTTVAATPGSYTQIVYSISGGADAAKFDIDASTGALSFKAAPDFEVRADADGNNSYIVRVRATENSKTDEQTITVNVTDVNDSANTSGLSGNDSFTAPAGNSRVDGAGGVDTMNFNFKLTDATVTYVGNQIIIASASSTTVVTGFEKYVFTDGTVDNWDGSSLIDDLFYYSRNHDVWNAKVDADSHFNTFGWKEGRDPNAFFDTKGYLAAYTDVANAGVNPLTHYDVFGFKEGRDPSVNFDTKLYLNAYPDVASAGVDPLGHFLTFGHQEGRTPFADGVFA